MALISDQGVVLRRLDYSETSQVLAIFTREHGLVRAIAKGIKRSTRTRFAAAIDLLDVGDVVVSARSTGQQALATLTEWKQRRPLVALRESLPRLYGAQYAAEVTVGLTADWDPHRKLYEAVVRLLEELCGTDNALPALVSFLNVLLDEVGSTPELGACVGCRKTLRPETGVSFSSFEGGLLCRDCEPAYVEKRGVAPDVLALLQGGQPRGPGTYAQAFGLLNYHLSHLMGRAPALADKVLGTPTSK
jgi:DNA repair protein RecO (recombination protein O)